MPGIAVYMIYIHINIVVPMSHINSFGRLLVDWNAFILYININTYIYTRLCEYIYTIRLGLGHSYTAYIYMYRLI